MKPFNQLLLCALLTLNSFTAYGMDPTMTTFMRLLGPAENNFPLQASLGEPIGVLNNTKKQDLLANNIPVGTVRYTDSLENSHTVRSIDDLHIATAWRNYGVGTTCMNLFIAQSRQEDIKKISLFSKPQAINFYKKLGFQSDDLFAEIMTLTL